MKKIRVQYYAKLREERGRAEETVRTTARTAAEFFEELHERFGFSLRREQLRVAVNESFSDWEHALHEDDLVVFIPPVAGG
jgi:molybdopterin converting factor subunit 1